MNTPLSSLIPLTAIAAAIIAMFGLLAMALSGLVNPAYSDTVTSKPTSSANAPARKIAADSEARAHCGHVESVRLVKVRDAGSRMGAFAGGVDPEAIGSESTGNPGKEKCNALMTILGIGKKPGRPAVNMVEAASAYLVQIRMDDGSARIVTLADEPTVAVGDQVRIINGGLAAIG